MPPPTPAWCPICGFPGSDSRCVACGQSAPQPSPRQPAPAASSVEESDTPAELVDTLSYFHSGNYGYYVPRCLNKIGSVSMPVDQPDGKFWCLTLDRPSYRQVGLMVGLDPRGQILSIEAPLVDVNGPATPVLRTALELNSELPQGARVVLRVDVLLLRCASPLAALRPLRLIRHVMACADLSKDLEHYFVTRFRCSPASLAGVVSLPGASRAIRTRSAPIKIELGKLEKPS